MARKPSDFWNKFFKAGAIVLALAYIWFIVVFARVGLLWDGIIGGGIEYLCMLLVLRVICNALIAYKERHMDNDEAVHATDNGSPLVDDFNDDYEEDEDGFAGEFEDEFYQNHDPEDSFTHDYSFSSHAGHSSITDNYIGRHGEFDRNDEDRANSEEMYAMRSFDHDADTTEHFGWENDLNYDTDDYDEQEDW